MMKEQSMMQKNLLEVIGPYLKNRVYVSGCKARPASSGIWLAFLLPIATVLSATVYSHSLTSTYRAVGVFGFALIPTTLIFIRAAVSHSSKNVVNANEKLMSLVIAVVIVTAGTDRIHVSLGSYLLSSIIGTYLSSYGLFTILPRLMKYLPKGFTFGEAAVITDGFLMFSYAAVYQILNVRSFTPNVTNYYTVILQVILIVILTICFTLHHQQIKTTWLIITVAFVGVSIIFTILTVVLVANPFHWFYLVLIANERRLAVMLHWSVCVGLATFFVHVHVKQSQRTTTAVRKIFHVLAVLVFVPGLLYDCNLLYFASGVTLAVFIILETVRLLDFPYVGQHLQEAFLVLSDDKDAAGVSLTPIYLLAGFSIPLWMHPCACDLTDAAGFNLLPLLAGVMSTGVGDTAASVVGFHYGKHKWAGSNKSIEGTVCCFLSQILFLACFFKLGFILVNYHNVIKSVISALVVSIVEAKTDQIDNLALPLVAYIILIL